MTRNCALSRSLRSAVVMVCLLLLSPAAIAGDGGGSAAPKTLRAISNEIAFWQGVDKWNTKDLRAYLSTYPDGTFAPIARNRLEKIEILRQVEWDLDRIILSLTDGSDVKPSPGATVIPSSDELE